MTTGPANSSPWAVSRPAAVAFAAQSRGPWCYPRGVSRLTARAARGTASATALAMLLAAALAGGATGVGWAAASPRADRTDRADAAAVAVATASGRLTRTSVDAMVGGGTVTR